jgi:hypothetical protein
MMAAPFLIPKPDFAFDSSSTIIDEHDLPHPSFSFIMTVMNFRAPS